ncbi:MAG: phospholipid-binding protein MlaC [Rhodospirillales bacterium]
MLNRRRVFRALLGPAILLAIAFTGGASFGAGVDKRAETFIRSLADQAIESLTEQQTSRDVRIQRFRRMFNDHFAVRAIGRFVLGRYWRNATAKEQREYLDLFEDLMVVSYVDRFQRYAGENLKIIQSRGESETTATVITDIVRPGGAKPVRMFWRVGAKGETMKILDVVVEGASMSQTLRSDFGSIIRQKKGKVAGLLEELRLKTASLKQRTAN